MPTKDQVKEQNRKTALRIIAKRTRDAKAGRKRREYVTTDTEHAILRSTLDALRGGAK